MNAQRTPTIVPRMLSVPTHLARSTARATVVTMEMDVPVQVRCLAGPSCSSLGCVLQKVPLRGSLFTL